MQPFMFDFTLSDLASSLHLRIRTAVILVRSLNPQNVVASRTTISSSFSISLEG